MSSRSQGHASQHSNRTPKIPFLPIIFFIATIFFAPSISETVVSQTNIIGSGRPVRTVASNVFHRTYHFLLGRCIGEAGYISFKDTNLSPNPAPSPDNDSTVCQNCDGTGKVGDGRVFTICKECNGTGKITSSQDVEPEVTVTETKPLPVWLNASYRYPNWTYPGSIYDHLFEEPHYSALKEAGYTDTQLRSITVREAELLHNHLHNYFDRRGVQQVSPASTSSYSFGLFNSSSCPGGNCPTGPATFMPFGGRFRR